MNDQEIIRSLVGGTIKSITLITGKGYVNRVYKVVKSDEPVIVRLNDESELKRFEKEAWCMERALKAGIPSPKLVDLGVVNNSAYMILSFVAGKNGKEIVADNCKVWNKIGTYAKKINSISTSGFGENVVAPGVFSGSWEKYLKYNIESLCPKDELLKLGVISQRQSELIKEEFTRLRDKQFNFALVHGDLSLENVIVNGEDITLIDWGCAESTMVPHMEIIAVLQNLQDIQGSYFNDFLAGYGISRDEFELIRPEIDSLVLLQAVDKLRWAIDKKPDQISSFSDRVERIVKRI